MVSEFGRKPSSGIGFVEALVVLLIASLLASIAYPQIEGVRTRQMALAATQDLNALGTAGTAHRTDRGDWPNDIPTLEGPGPLGSYLPPGFLFVRNGYELTWERWVLPNGLPPGSDSTTVVAVTFRSENPDLGREIDRALGGDIPWFSVGERSTFILDGF